MDASTSPAMIRCDACLLRKMSGFRSMSSEEAKLVADFKSGEMRCDPGMNLISEGTFSPHLYTVLEGWGFRYKSLEDGRRQILNYLVPGDLIGLQGALLQEMDHSVEALTPMRLCVFERSRFLSIFEKSSTLAFDVTWLASREERILDGHMLSLGQRTALERAAYLLVFLYFRGLRSGLVTPTNALLPLNQNLIADTLGLSLVHTNKTLKRLAQRKLIAWKGRACEILDPEGLSDVAEWEPPVAGPRPLI
ncbi:cAMP-binding domain of CRP or a regulatory subunit of cAMP-dependent protein kinases [Ensifer adhaerens]|nr:cAMP-binding domain of CRP or a regulatory subunit of cAMP-dependent protein kinases [Ensifer adhaerens]HZG29643.1 Crp/Fnr family transcriptional regulator [Ensifer sp.]